MKSQYLNTGKVRFAYRDFPRDERGWGLVAAHAARCAGEQGQYWPMHDRLFDQAGRLGTGVLMRIAKDMRLKADLFGTCMDSQKHVDSIMADKELGEQLGFRGTPSFLIVRTAGDRFSDPVRIPGAALRYSQATLASCSAISNPIVSTAAWESHRSITPRIRGLSLKYLSAVAPEDCANATPRSSQDTT